MRLGALIVTTGLKENAGVASLLKPTGTVNAGQRMISAFQCCNVSCIGLVLEKGNRKEQRQFAREGVLFFGTEDAAASMLEGAQLGLAYMADKFDRIFLVTGDQALFLPETLRTMLEQAADVVVPTYSQMNGCPVLLSNAAVLALLKMDPAVSLEKAVQALSVPKAFVPVKDPGILVQGLNDQNRKALVRKQEKQILRPATDVKIQIGNLLFDGRLAGLLRLIDETHSVRQASELMQISYSTAWGLLNGADDILDHPLILRKRGGPGGSGCELSSKGRFLLNAYDRYCAAVSYQAQALYQKMFEDILK